jgi:hypothetical protein
LGEVEVPRCHRDIITSLWIKKQGNPKQKNISDNQQPSRDKQLSKRLDLNTAAVVVNEEALERILERMFEVKILRVSSSRAVRGHRSGRGIYFVSLGWFLFIAFICLQC